ncbi:cation:proton antiporter [Thioclava sp. GXIMD2076]|uniref:cation:proton antiporter n=1 Tax=Thioclava sp. GXIMD2076 TaxID=3131931 RepID=UPI0030CD82ED
MDIVIIVAIIASLFFVIGVAEPLAARLRLPYSVIIAALGMLIGSAAIFFLQTTLTDALNPVAEAILGLPIRANVFLYIFLPLLLFQVTLGMNLRRMMDDWVPILVMAVVAVVVATLSVGYALSYISSLPLAACLLVGAIVSTTDPSAVVSIFRSLSAPQRLARIIEGESLLNDAAAIALFGLFIGYVMLGVPDPELGEALGRFPMLIAGGAATGWVLSQIGLRIMGLFPRYELAQMSVSVALPYLSYIIAEQLIGASGVIAVVAAGLTLNLAGPGRIEPQTWTNMRETWDLVAHWAGALIFILAALLIPRLLEGTTVTDFLLIGVVVVAAIAARAVILWGLLPVLTLLRLSPPVERPYRVAILWGGLRGAVTLALALAVTENALVPVEIKRVVGILATGFTLFTLIVQGTTLRSVIGKLGLDKLSPLDQALANQVIAVSLQTVREDVAKSSENYNLNHEIIRAEAKRFGERLDSVVRAAEAGANILDRDRITLGLIALAGFEREQVLSRLRDRSISSRIGEAALSQTDHLIEGARAQGRTGYQRAARSAIDYGRAFRIANFLHNRLRFSMPLALLTADRFERLLSQRMILRDLDAFIDARIRRIHGRRVADLLHELLARRVEALETALYGLRLQYPGYAEELERRLIRRTALRMEEREYNTMHEDGLISEEVFTSLMQDISARRLKAEERPMLDLQVQRADILRRMRLFEDLDERIRKPLGRSLRTRYFDPGDKIMRKERHARSVFFIASGAVELETAGQISRLGRGDMFGELALLTGKPRRTDVRAIAPSTILELDEKRFRKLLRRSPAIREAAREAAEKRGISIDDLLEETAPETAK